MIHYRDGMTDAEVETMLRQERALDAAYEAATGPTWEHQLGDAIWLQCKWEEAGAEFGAPRADWDTETHRRYFVEDCMENELVTLRKAALNHRGLP